MDRSSPSRLFAAGSEHLLRQLTIQQHLKPSRPIRQTVAMVCRDDGFPQTAGESAIALVGVPGDRPVGRLSRQQIRDLAQKIEFSWQTELASQFRMNQPRPGR